MLVVFFGPPGAGKGTQASRLADEHGYDHVETGAMLRTAMREETELGETVRSYMDEGKLVPDEIMIEVVRELLNDLEGDAVFDGFPRTVEQARALDKLLLDRRDELGAVIHFELSDSAVVERLSGRRVCPQCSSTFHRQHNPPMDEGICDQCGAHLEQRDSDQSAMIRERLKEYHEKTQPLSGYYNPTTIQADQSIEVVYDQLLDTLDRPEG